MSGLNTVSDGTGEPTLDEQAAAIAQKYLDTIPPEDEQIADRMIEHLRILLAAKFFCS